MGGRTKRSGLGLLSLSLLDRHPSGDVTRPWMCIWISQARPELERQHWALSARSRHLKPVVPYGPFEVFMFPHNKCCVPSTINSRSSNLLLPEAKPPDFVFSGGLPGPYLLDEIPCSTRTQLPVHFTVFCGALLTFKSSASFLKASPLVLGNLGFFQRCSFPLLSSPHISKGRGQRPGHCSPLPCTMGTSSF